MIKSVILFFIFTQSFAADLSFDQAVETILKRDELIKASDVKLSAASLSKLSSKTSFLPSLEIGAQRTKNFVTDSDLDKLYLSSSLNLYKGGADLAQLKLSSALLGLAREEKNETYLKRENNAIERIIGFMLKKKEIDILKKQVAIIENSLKVTESRYKAGLSPLQESQKVKVDLLNAKARLFNIEIAFEQTKAEIVSLLGSFQLASNWPWLKKLKELNFKKIHERKLELEENLRFKKASFELSRQEASSKYYRAQMYPSLDLTLSLSHNELDDSPRYYERVGLINFSVPLFSGLTDIAAYKSQNAQEVLARAKLIHTKRSVLSSWESMKNNLVRIIKTAQSREETLSLSRKLFQTSEGRFERGRVSVNDLLIDQNRLFESESLAAKGWAEAHLEYLNYCHTLALSYKTCLQE